MSKKTLSSAIALGLASQFALMSITAVNASNAQVGSLNEAYVSSDARAMTICGYTGYDTGGDTTGTDPDSEDDVVEDTVTENVTIEDDTVTVEVSSTLVDDVAITEITSDLLDQVLDSLLAEGTDNLVIPIEVSDSGAAQVALPLASLLTATESGVSLTIPSPVGTISLDNEALGAILSQLGEGTLEIFIGQASTSDLNEAQQSVLAEKANRPFFEFFISTNGEPLEDFCGANVEVTVPFQLPEGVLEDTVQMKAIGEDGTVTLLPTYYSDEIVSCTTSESALFIVDYD